MNSHRTRDGFRVIAAAMAVLLAAVVVWNAHSARAASRAADHAGATAGNAASHLADLMPSERLTFATERARIVVPAREMTSVLLVDAEDVDGTYAGHMVVAAQTGEVLQTTLASPHGPRASGAPYNRNEAVAAARHWLDVLGIVPVGTNRIPVVALTNRGHVWLVWFAVRERTARVAVESCTGALVSACTSEAKRHGPMCASRVPSP